MAVLAIFTVRGDTDDLLRRYDAAMPAIVASSPGKPVSHTCTPAVEGIRIYDLWDSPELLEDFTSNPDFLRAITEAGLPAPEVEVVPVHRAGW